MKEKEKEQRIKQKSVIFTRKLSSKERSDSIQDDQFYFLLLKIKTLEKQKKQEVRNGQKCDKE